MNKLNIILVAVRANLRSPNETRFENPRPHVSRVTGSGNALRIALRDRWGCEAFVCCALRRPRGPPDHLLAMAQQQLLKHEWPQRWTSFIPDLVCAAKTNETLCENCMHILKARGPRRRSEASLKSPPDATARRGLRPRVLPSPAPCPAPPRARAAAQRGGVRLQ